MKTLKKLLSLALALVMVVGALVVLPTEAKADAIATLTSTAEANAATGKFGFKLSDYCANYVDGADYKITVVLSSDGAAGSFGGGVGAATQDADGWTQVEWSGAGATTTAVLEGKKLHEDRAEVQVWWLGEGNSVTIESITVEKIQAGSEGGENDGSKEEVEGGSQIHKFVPVEGTTKPAAAFEFEPSKYCEGYANGKDYIVTVKMSSDGEWCGMLGGCKTSAYDWMDTGEVRGNLT